MGPNPVTDFGSALAAMLNLKPPGVSGSRILSLTSLCVANIESESALIQKLYTHFKKAPHTHKLGVLYVVDSVTRKWLEQAKANGQEVKSSAPHGTFAAGVHRVTELMPVMMNDIAQTAPEEQKEKIRKLVDIWEKGSTFPAPMIEDFKKCLDAPKNISETSTTPPGSPSQTPAAAAIALAPGKTQLAVSAPALVPATAPVPAAVPVDNGQSILDALAKIAQQNTSVASNVPSVPAPSTSYTAPVATGTIPQPVSSVAMPQPQPIASYQQQAAQPPMNFPPQMPFGMPNIPVQAPGMGMGMGALGNAGSVQNTQFPGAHPPAGAGMMDPNVQQQFLLIKALADQGIPVDSIPAIIAGLNANNALAGGAMPQGQMPIPQHSQLPPGQASWNTQAPNPEQGRDWYNKDNSYGNNDAGLRYDDRSRSRSPDRGWGNRGSTRGGRNTDYGRNSPDRGGRRGTDEYRDRSPSRRRGQSPPPGEKWTDFDPNLPSGSIKVLSRTLFVGGVTCSEAELRSVFGAYGSVQTCIVNKDKRHAFVKMLTRRDAVAVKTNTEDGTRNHNLSLRTRWGVGFGPRDCSDYSSGISVIPVHRLTEADRKWLLTAPHGGSGGRPIETGLVVEEPDIEIGAGVSSKAISRRMQTDKGGANGPKSTRQRGEEWSGNGNNNNRGRAGGSGDDQGQGFPFGLGTLPNGMPNFPPGFTFPDPNSGSSSGQNTNTKWA